MRTELLGQEKNIVKIKLEIEPSEFSKALTKALNELSQKVSIPGFRKGRAPRSVLEMRFGRNAIYNEAIEKIMPENIRQIVDDYELEPLDSPILDIKGEIKEGEPIICELSFEVKPEVELPEIENLEIEKLNTVVTDDDVNKFIKRIRVQQAEVKTVERPVQDDDLIDVDLTIRTLNQDGSEESEQLKTESSKEKINLSDDTIRFQVREALIGHSKGETVQTTFDVEPGHADKTLAGKKVKYIMTIEGISEFILPELNEDFYKKIFGPETDILNEDLFRARLHDDISEEVSETQANDLRNRAIALVAGLSKLEIPDNLIARQERAMRRDDENWAKSNELNLNDIYGLNTKEGLEGYKKLLRTRAETAVRDVLVMDEVAKKYDVHVEREDLEAEFNKRAKQIKSSPAFVANYFYKNKEQLDKLIDELRYEKVADVMISNMKVKEVSELSQIEYNEHNHEDEHKKEGE